MEEPKFRGYSIGKLAKGQWIEGHGVFFIEFADDYAEKKGRKGDWCLLTESGDYLVYPESIGQCTKLKDVEDIDIDIFQGDIVEMGWSDQVGESHGGRVVIKNPFDYSMSELGYLNNADYLRVIGNTYENPELIK